MSSIPAVLIVLIKLDTCPDAELRECYAAGAKQFL